MQGWPLKQTLGHEDPKWLRDELAAVINTLHNSGWMILYAFNVLTGLVAPCSYCF